MIKKLAKKIDRMVMDTNLMLHAHILNPLWISRNERRNNRYLALQASRLKYLSRYATDIKQMVPEAIDNSEEPEHIFTLWLQGEDKAPELVKACIRSMRRCFSLPVVVLDSDSLWDWISLPDYIVDKWKKGIITNTHFSDICRIELLYQHGGVWSDATNYATSPIPDYIMDEDVFFFMAGRNTGGWYAGIQSCFIRAKRGNPLIGIWREAIYKYWKEEDSLIDYFTLHLLLLSIVKYNAVAIESYDKMPKILQDPTHALWFGHWNDPYTASEYDMLTKNSFFQKTSYKNPNVKEFTPGSIADHMIKL